MDGSKDLQSNRHSLTGLLAAIEAEFSDHIMPNLPADQNFRKAMIRRALHILIRQLDIDKTAQTELAQKTAMADCTELATALRNRSFTSLLDAELKEALASYVEAKLSLTNPDFLAQGPVLR